MLMFSLCRILFYLFNTNLFADMTFSHFLHLMRGGLKFDLSASLYTNALFIVGNIVPFAFRHSGAYQSVMKWIFGVCNSLALALNCIDIIYYRFTLRRTTWAALGEFSNDKGNFPLMMRFLLDYWYIFFIWIAMTFLLIWLYTRIKINPKPTIRIKPVYYAVCTLAMAVILTLFVGGVRGGFAHSTRPITISNAAAYTNKPVETGLVLNTPFSIYRTLKRATYPRLDYYAHDELNAIFTPVHLPADTAKFRRKNVVIFILESMSKEFIGAFNKNLDKGNYKGYTPFLDSLVEAGYTFEHSFSNGSKSIDAMPSILASVPSFTDPYVLSIYSNNTVKGLAALLAAEGYDCSFFHGAPNGSMGFDAFAATSGFQHYYGKTEYNNDADFDGMWGIWDEPFFQYFAHTLDEKNEPFMASLFSVSSHHPFALPKEYEGKFPEGTQQIHKCIGYTDHALRRFFETASQMSWFENTLFVLVADHTNQLSYPESLTSVGHFSVPIIFYDPSGELRGFDRQRTAQQIDVMPSVLTYLHYDKPYFAFGFDLLSAVDSARNTFSINYLNGAYQLYSGNYVFQTQLNEAVALYDYVSDPLLSVNLIETYPNKVKELTRMFHAFIQQYNNSLIDNRMTAD
jgi:phosphoglycerol transferase MdoB-like AlkP superfamily enzyme